ncbi:MAG: hypothetical protein IPM59_06990 [Chloracidobacterium sp.]|nr:hypothetical protein [Chloracidobacterium sp.]
MISAASVAEIIATYAKHGWLFRRVLLSDASRKALADRADELFADVDINTSRLDAAWFSRPPKPGETAWELRYLGDIAYAVLEYVDEDSAGFETALADVEARMAEAITRKHQA